MSALKFHKWGTFLSLLNGQYDFLAAVYPLHAACQAVGRYEISMTVLVVTEDKDGTVSSFYSASYFKRNEMKSFHYYKLKKLFFSLTSM